MSNFQFDNCVGEMSHNPETNVVTLKGSITENVVGGIIKFIAAAPLERRASFTGSGLPFANASQAFDNTPNKGSIELGFMNKFEFSVIMPNTYCVGLGTVEVPPTVFIMYNNGDENKKVGVRVGSSCPYRSLTYPTGRDNGTARKDCMFYKGLEKLPVRTQEQIIRDSAYTDDSMMHKNHWGFKPPV